MSAMLELLSHQELVNIFPEKLFQQKCGIWLKLIPHRKYLLSKEILPAC